MKRKSIVLAIVLLLALTSGQTVVAHTGFNNNSNGDSYVDALHVKIDNVQIYNDKYDGGYRVVALTGSSIDPHWNQQPNGRDFVRVFTFTNGAYYAMRAKGIGADLNNTYPAYVKSAFYLLSDGGSITGYSPTTSGNQNAGFASILLDLDNIVNNQPVYVQLANYVFQHFGSPGGGGIQDTRGSSEKDYAYTSTYYSSKADWLNKTNSGKSDLPTSVTTANSHQDAYQSYGIAHWYDYTDNVWAHDSQQPVQFAASVQYWTLIGSGWYSYDSGWTYAGFYDYGY